jgi:TetR/AcrR family transcriptional regulator, transcriptional repressor for nem operon
MGRGIEFDYDKAIDRATRVFWKTGYSNTSLRDLLKAMKIGEGSFYNTVKSKKNLYLECLKHYRATVINERHTALFSQKSAKLGVRALFKTVLDQMDDPKRPGLCLMAGSLSRDVLDEKDLREYIVGESAASGGSFIGLLKSAQESGELPKELDPTAVVQIILTYIQGMSRAAQISYDRQRIERQVEVLLKGLGL